MPRCIMSTAAPLVLDLTYLSIMGTGTFSGPW
jgi:hypothetical protein